jgi:hypothetical protein
MGKCNKCGSTEKRKDGRCAPCSRILAAQYYYAHREEIRAQQKKYSKKNAPRIKKYSKNYREEHAEEIRLQRADYRKANPQKVKARASKYYASNRDKIREYQAAYYRANSATAKARTKAWRLANPGHRARHTYGLTLSRWHTLLIAQSGRCWLCDRPLFEVPKIDHDHTTGVVRGLAHGNCNAAFGLLHEDPYVFATIAKNVFALKGSCDSTG